MHFTCERRKFKLKKIFINILVVFRDTTRIRVIINLFIFKFFGTLFISFFFCFVKKKKMWQYASSYLHFQSHFPIPSQGEVNHLLISQGWIWNFTITNLLGDTWNSRETYPFRLFSFWSLHGHGQSGQTTSPLRLRFLTDYENALTLHSFAANTRTTKSRQLLLPQFSLISKNDQKAPYPSDFIPA